MIDRQIVDCSMDVASQFSVLGAIVGWHRAIADIASATLVERHHERFASCPL